MQLNETGPLIGIHAQRDGFFDVLRQAGSSFANPYFHT